MSSMDFDRQAWIDPPADYRPIPFWSLNDVLEPAELRRQLRAFAERGFGGVFMHARIGLITPYLGEDWFAAIRTIVDTAAELGLQAWIYDEDRWPSGYAGGHIASIDDLDYPARGLACIDDGDGERRYEVIYAPASANFNGIAPPNVLDPDVTRAFVELTHERYADVIGDQLGGVCPGSFTDEPSYVLWESDRRYDVVPWTGALPEEFHERRGYRLEEHLHQLFVDEGDYASVRVDFYRTVTELFVENFTGLLDDWCRDRGLLSTGHMMMEDTLLSQVQAIGAAMPHYEAMTVPGIDLLGDGIREAPVVSLQAASVARQLGRRLLCEIWGGSSWRATLGGLKPAGDWAAALGVNLINQHLSYYSIRGCRKWDYPHSCSYHIPGFALYRPFNDYWGRLSYLTTRGKPVVETLVLHPMSSAWAAFSPADTSAVTALNNRFETLCQGLLEAQRSFDLGDETLLARYGQVEDGRLQVGEASYGVVVVPPSTIWWPETINLLRRFVRAGGRLVVVDDVPAEIAELGGERTPLADLPGAVPPAAIKVTDALTGEPLRETVCQHRRCANWDIFFVSCARAAQPLDLRVLLLGEGAVERWHPEDGRIEMVAADVRGTGTEVLLQVPPRGSFVLVLDRGRPAPHVPLPPVAHREVLEDGWEVERLDPNVLLLDHARLRYGSAPWSEPMGAFGDNGLAAIPNVHDTVATGAAQKHIGNSWPIEMAYEFTSRIAGDAEVVVEDTRVFGAARFNDHPLAVAEDRWWLDRGFAVLPAPDALRPGINHIVGSIDFRPPRRPGTTIFTANGTEIENAVLRGDFNVAWDGEATFIVDAPSPLPTDPRADLTRAGLPFYVGAVRYRRTLAIATDDRSRRCLLHLPQPDGEGVRVLLNGTEAVALWCAPFVADLSDHLRPGTNTLEIVLYSTLGNVFGPLHHERPWVDPAHRFAAYRLLPLGLGGVPELEYR